MATITPTTADIDELSDTEQKVVETLWNAGLPVIMLDNDTFGAPNWKETKNCLKAVNVDYRKLGAANQLVCFEIRPNKDGQTRMHDYKETSTTTTTSTRTRVKRNRVKTSDIPDNIKEHVVPTED